MECSPPLLFVSGRSAPLVHGATIFIVTAVALISAGGRYSPSPIVRPTLLASTLKSESFFGCVTPQQDLSARKLPLRPRTIFVSADD
jgi:hypothetical protein